MHLNTDGTFEALSDFCNLRRSWRGNGHQAPIAEWSNFTVHALRLAPLAWTLKPLPPETVVRNTRIRLGIQLAEAVLQENLQRDVLLSDESALRQLTRHE